MFLILVSDFGYCGGSVKVTIELSEDDNHQLYFDAPKMHAVLSDISEIVRKYFKYTDGSKEDAEKLLEEIREIAYNVIN
jgi:hypothetical protein